MTKPSGRALAGILAVFAELERDILKDRVRSGIVEGRKYGTPHERRATVRKYVPEFRDLFATGVIKREIAKRLKVSRTHSLKSLR